MNSDHSMKRTVGVAALLYLAFAILMGLADMAYILRHYTRFPFGDHWMWLERLYRSGLLRTLYSQFNEHRYVIPGLWYFLDHRYFGGTNTFLVVLMVLMQIGCTILVILPLWRQTGVPKPVRYVFAGFVVLAMWWFIQAGRFFLSVSDLHPMLQSWNPPSFLHLLARFAERNKQSRPVLWVGTGMLVCSLWANFSNGHGILVWPILLAAGLLLRLPVRWILIAALVMLASLGIYFFHYHNAKASTPVHSNRCDTPSLSRITSF